MTVCFQLCTATVLWLSAISSVSADTRLLTIADVIETTRTMIDGDRNSVFLSPDRQKYVVMLISGDARHDVVRSRLLIGRLSSLETAQPVNLAQFVTRGLGSDQGFGHIGGAPALTQPGANVPVWIDSSRVAILWETEQGSNQLTEVDVYGGDTTLLTNHPTEVASFGFSPTGAVIYDARVAYSKGRSEAMLHNGFSVINHEALSLLSGIVDGTSIYDFGSCDRFIISTKDRQVRKIAVGRSYCQSSLVSSRSANTELFSPDGELAIINAEVMDVPKMWFQYDHAVLRRAIAERAVSPHSLYSKLVQQLFVVDLATAIARPLWNVPIDPSQPVGMKWSPDSESVLVWPTFLPIDEHAKMDVDGEGIAEVSVSTGSFVTLPLDREQVQQITMVRWVSDWICEVELKDGVRVRLEKVQGRWLVKPRDSVERRDALLKSASPVLVDIRQSKDQPPVLYAHEMATCREVALYELNPRLGKELTLGRVEFIEWKDSGNRTWIARLYYPVRYDPAQRYPLVVQTHGYADEREFSLYGQGNGAVGLGPGWSVYLAQPLANQGVAVLQTGGPVGGYPSSSGLSVMQQAMVGLEAGIERLVSLGLVDRNRVGLMGHSATGRLVEYVLTHSSFPYAAAIAADHADANYVQAALQGWPAYSADANGGPPFGEHMTEWLRNSPAFRASHLRTPLQLQVTSSSQGFGSLLWGWEMFSRLRWLRRPVEYYVIPNIRRGSHILQNPRQLLTLQNRALDWWRFWLQGEENADPERAERYGHWRKLRDLHTPISARGAGSS